MSTAENERIKLTAIFWNNAAVGAAITGLVVPYITLYPKIFAETWSPKGFADFLASDTSLVWAWPPSYASFVAVERTFGLRLFRTTNGGLFVQKGRQSSPEGRLSAREVKRGTCAAKPR